MEPSLLFEFDEVKSRSSKAWSAIITYRSLDREARKLGVTRQSVIKI